MGSGCGDPPVFRRAIAAARQLFDYAESIGYRFNLLDIGGGFPGNKGTSVDKVIFLFKHCPYKRVFI